MIGMTSKVRRAALLAPLAAALVLLVATSAGATGTYGDATGDSGAAPDITKVTVTSDPAGTIRFEIGVASLSSDATTVLALDTDRDLGTGSDGDDYLFAVDEADNAYYFVRWNGSGWEEAPNSTVGVFSTPTSGPTTVRIVVNRSELGDTSGFDFWVRTLAGDATDDAPEAGTWNYTLAAGGPDIRGVIVSNTPLLPTAGRTFSVRPVGVRLQASGGTGLAPPPDGYRCRATLAGRAVTGTGVGGCTWKLPKTARGRMLAVTVTVTYQGATKSVPFSYRVA